MNHEHHHDQQPGQLAAPPFWRSRYAIGLIVFGTIAGYFLLSEHRAHFFVALPFLFLLVCPLMHLFMHGGHGGHGGSHAGHDGSEQGSKTPTSPQPVQAGEKP